MNGTDERRGRHRNARCNPASRIRRHGITAEAPSSAQWGPSEGLFKRCAPQPLACGNDAGTAAVSLTPHEAPIKNDDVARRLDELRPIASTSRLASLAMCTFSFSV